MTAHFFASLQKADEVFKLARSSFCEARQKLSWQAFEYLLIKSQVKSQDRWKGHRVRAVDGTCILLPHAQEILKSYPIRKSHFGEVHYPQLHLVAAVDVFTRQPTDVVTGNKSLSEREVLRQMVAQFNPGDICILDRGFDGHQMWQHFDQYQQHYVARLRCNGRGQLRFDHRLKDQVVKSKGLKVRVIRGPKLKNGQYLFLGTNLVNTRKYKRYEVLSLYSQRQAVEEMFLHLKQNLGVNKIRSKKTKGVLQEVYACLTMASVIAGVRYLLKRRHKKWRISFKALVWVFEMYFYELLIALNPAVLASIIGFGHWRQPGRSYPRYSRQPENKWIKEKRRKKERRKT